MKVAVKLHYWRNWIHHVWSMTHARLNVRISPLDHPPRMTQDWVQIHINESNESCISQTDFFFKDDQLYFGNDCQ